jgi:hypothetical protein
MALDVSALCQVNNVTDKHRRRRFTHAGMYDRIFLPYKDKPIKLLEIGVNKGGSAAVWEAYFPNATLFGIDIRSKKELLRRMRRANSGQTGRRGIKLSRTQIDIVDQSDAVALKAYAEKYGPFDIIIDDGSHYCSHQILSFETLWSYLNVGGTYVIEDTTTSIPGAWKDSTHELYADDSRKYLDCSPTCMEYFHTLVDTACMYIGEISDQPKSHQELQSITFKYDMIVVNKEAPHE